MTEKSYVVVFPSVFSKNKIPQLISNIKKILKIREQEFKSVKRDGDVILVDANDPVFASSAINLLFGIEKIAIARQVENNLKTLVSEITSLGGNLLLKGEKFLVRVEGHSKGFLPKDVELSATSSIIEKKSKLGAKPGTEENFDKLLYSYLTKKNAYICIFIDDGFGGIPYGIHRQKAVCCIYDELSAISCLETIKQGYDTKFIVCYNQKSDLLNLVKMINQILPRLLSEKIEIDFFKQKITNSRKNYLSLTSNSLSILLWEAKKTSTSHVSLPVSPMIFPSKIIDYFIGLVTNEEKSPVLPIFGLDSQIFEDAKEIGLERKIPKLQRLVSSNFKQLPSISKKDTEISLKSRKRISVKVGPNNVHDILDCFD